MHCWVPRTRKLSKPNLVLVHGFGANAMWQYGEHLRHFIDRFNVYVPDLLFFGESYTSRPERHESFQAQCLMRLMESQGVHRMSLVGISYGGFVGYSLAAQFPTAVEKIVLCCAGVMCTEFAEEKRELIQAILKGRKLSKLPRITQYNFTNIIIPTLLQAANVNSLGRARSNIPSGTRAQITKVHNPCDRHVGESAELVVIKNAGHAVNLEKAKEFAKHLKSFLIDSVTSLSTHQYHLFH
ncbi:hypothetical protein GH714_027144 [Hevea brasiliensis]|uniref:AB hydrolase-1 domain-containing protein n=1 Tax=Hevea brasiliensis TaxID=3981 RepID=A0A6A6N661_HEVBR|nr:hypothetical protein GH714_027144 [Hevea brasiliensis]